MSKPSPQPPPETNAEMVSRPSMRGGALAVRSAARFLIAARRAKSLQSGGDGTTKSTKRGGRMAGEDESKCAAKVMEAARKNTLLTRKELESLYKIYKKLITFNKSNSKGKSAQNSGTTSTIGKPKNINEGIDRAVFREVLHNTFDIFTENTLIDRIFCYWDKNNCGLITIDNWFRGLSLFLRGTMADQIEYCFAVYDLNSDGYITKDEMFQLLRNCLIKHPQEEDPDESVKDFIDIVMKKIDKDKDGKVSLEDFQQTVEEEPLLLEAFGKCLPSEESKTTFLTTLKS